MIKLSKALAIFREEVSVIAKQTNNPFFKSKYADLPSILEGIKEPLKKSGLSLFHKAENSEDGYYLISTLTETESGESISSAFPLFGSKPQEVGSSLTYARRYNTLALLDIPTDEDDDGNKANTATRTQKQTVDTPTGGTKPKILTSTNEFCPECGEECKTKHGTTKEGKPYEMGTCDSCDIRFFVNRKPDLSEQPF
ncbi:MAG TPA: ERF family protein [Candidatus Absconditabacterales bacterium]|nr:ERF family protein [Candidatus Absconditabacterales bacterium]